MSHLASGMPPGAWELMACRDIQRGSFFRCSQSLAKAALDLQARGGLLTISEFDLCLRDAAKQKRTRRGVLSSLGSGHCSGGAAKIFEAPPGRCWYLPQSLYSLQALARLLRF